MEESSRRYTAFTVPGRPLYHFVVLPFGLTNAAQRLCRLMDKVIPQKLREKVFLYLDDLLIVSPTFEEHLVTLREVSQCLKEAGLTIGLKKSHFCFKELRSAKEVRRFLGTAGWYRRFVQNFAEMAAPLTDTLKKGKKFEMTKEATEAMRRLQEALMTAPVLRHPDLGRRFFVQCDASDYGVGAVLFQEKDEEGERPIAFFSQKLNSCQRNYSVTEKECYAAVLAIKRFRPYIEMMPFTWLLGFEATEFESEDYVELRKDMESNKEQLPDIKVVDGFIFKRNQACGSPELEEHSWKLWVPMLIDSDDDRASTFASYKSSRRDMVEWWLKSAMMEASTAAVIKFLTKEVFNTFGVPEVIHSDKGKQFVAKKFVEMTQSYQIRHTRTAIYSPSSNAAERVNQSVINAIRAYLEEDHRNWDLFLPEIEAALRSAIHQSTGVSPYFALFGQHMYTSGVDYQLARKLQSLEDSEIRNLRQEDRFALLRDTIRENLHKAHESSARYFNRRTREVKFKPGQEVFRRNFVLSDFIKNFNAKFARKFLKCRIRRPIGNNMYEVVTTHRHNN
nr:uncharacterized protein LOC123002443 [Drosophila takahashii]